MPSPKMTMKGHAKNNYLTVTDRTVATHCMWLAERAQDLLGVWGVTHRLVKQQEARQDWEETQIEA